MVVEEDIVGIPVVGIEDIVDIAEVDIVGSAVEVVEEDIPDMHDTVADIADTVAEEDIVGMGLLAGIVVGIGVSPLLGMVGIAWEDIEGWGRSSSSEGEEVLVEG